MSKLWLAAGAIVLVAASLGVIATSPFTSGEQIATTYVPEPPALGLATGQGFALHLFETPSKSQGFTRMPPPSGAKRYYDELRIGGREFRVITEATSPPRIWLDANDNGDLTDDAGPFPGETNAVVPNHYTLGVPFAGAAQATPYRLWLFESPRGGTCYYAKCHMVGRFETSKAWSLVLYDVNADGDYSNDPVAIDLDGNGRAVDSELFRPGQTFRLGDCEVTLLAIAPSGSSVRVRRAAAKRPA